VKNLKIALLCRRFALRAMLPVKNSTFLAALAAGEIRAPPDLAW